MDARILLEALIATSGCSRSDLSTMLGRNEAYVQQYVRRGTPRRLKPADEELLSNFFRLPPNFLRLADASGRHALLLLALHLAEKAMDLCDQAGVTLPQCHLQLGVDILRADVAGDSVQRGETGASF